MRFRSRLLTFTTAASWPDTFWSAHTRWGADSNAHDHRAATPHLVTYFIGRHLLRCGCLADEAPQEAGRSNGLVFHVQILDIEDLREIVAPCALGLGEKLRLDRAVG